MAVVVDSGPVVAEDKLRNVPKEKWRELMSARRYFMDVNLPYDCRCLIQFVDEAELMFEVLGFANPKSMIRDGYGLNPAEVDIAVKWLKLRKPNEPIPYLRAKAGRPEGDYTHNNPCSTRIKYGTKEHWLARFDRDGLTDLAAKVRAGELSANAAAIEAGFRKQRTPFQQVMKLLAKLTEEELESLHQHLHRLPRPAP